MEESGGLRQLWREGAYKLYVLGIFLLAYLLNQLDRYLLPITAVDIEKDIGFGEKSCQSNNSSSAIVCEYLVTRLHCEMNHVCYWDYNGKGNEYQILAGPVFVVIYTFVGIPVSFLAKRYNRKTLLAIAVIVWSAMTILFGASKQYWHLVLTRIGLGIGEAGCTPFVVSLMSDIFPSTLRGTVLGIYNVGIYSGYSISYALGNFIDSKLGWRWVFYICGIPGIVLGCLILLTIKEPVRKEELSIQSSGSIKKNFTVWETVKFFATARTLLLLCFAGAIRNAGGYVWAVNTETFYANTWHLTKYQIGTWMSWIPLVGGSLGAILGGFVSDRLLKHRGPTARVWVLVVSQLLAAPFTVGALFATPPWGFLCLIGSNILGEMWVGVTLACVVELVPNSMRSTAVALYLFIITNIGGNANVLVTPIEKHLSAHWTFFILFTGTYLAGALLFLVTLMFMKKDITKAIDLEEESQPVLTFEEETQPVE